LHDALGVYIVADNFIDARDFAFQPFPHPLHPDEDGDSGAMELATAKADPLLQYVIKGKGTYPEVACNEFMYHKVAAALGLYTQDVKLIAGNRDYRRAAAIRYVPEARKFRLDGSSVENYRTYFEFEALFVILNEEDSHEYYLDGQGRLFKLDNAASFHAEQATIMMLDGNPLGRFFVPNISAPLNAVGFNYYRGMYEIFRERYGQAAVESYLVLIQRFAELDETAFCEAYGDLDKQYPKALGRYYDEFIRIRKEICRRFLGETAGRCA
jgi:hypothetical protein